MLSWEVQRATRYQDFLSVGLIAVQGDPATPAAELREAVGRLFVDFLRASDVAGSVGDMLGILLVHTPLTDAMTIVHRVQQRIEEGSAGPAGAPAVRVRLKLGLSCFPTDGTADDQLLNVARSRVGQLS
jgi:GGDEF domain-containing protein